jgi:hypothetical protein
MPFVKGKSGNPGGRPAVAKVLAELGTDAGKITKELFQIAIAVAREKPRNGNDANWRYAHEWLANRVLGKPKETVTHLFGSDGDDSADMTELPEAELDRIIAEGDDAERVLATADDLVD